VSPSCLFSLLVVLPPGQCNDDVLLPTFLGSTGNQDYQPLAILAEINPVAGTKIDAVLVNARPYTLGVRKIALLDAGQRGCYLYSRLAIQAVKPGGVGARPAVFRYSRTSMIRPVLTLW
jgi:hypothetical protein